MKKLVCFLLSVIIVCACGLAVAAEPSPMQSVSAEPYVNGDYGISGEVSYGDTVTLSVENFMIGDESADESQLAFSWHKGIGAEQSLIADATGASYTFAAKESCVYDCYITGDGVRGASFQFTINVDTISCSLTSSNRFEADEDWTDSFFNIYDCVLGQDLTFTLNATSKVGGALTYRWYNWDDGETISTTDTLTVNKSTKGYIYYDCEVSDGNYTKNVTLRLHPIDTLTETVKINGITPERFERGHMAVAATGEEVKLTVKAETTNAGFTRRWERILWDGSDMSAGPVVTDLGTDETITVTKQYTGDADGYGFEQYECYLDDGNEEFQVGIVLFSLHPYQVTSKTESSKGTPKVTLDDSTETLANSLLQKNMELLEAGATAEITLTADKLDKISAAEDKAIKAVLPENSQIGAMLDINLYKELEGAEKTEITETSGEIQLSVAVPEDMLDNTSLDEFCVTRVHEGVAENLKCKYNADTKTVTFKTDRFSTYVLSVNGKKADTSSLDGSVKTDAKDQTKSPATSDKALPIVVFFASCVCLVLVRKGFKIFE